MSTTPNALLGRGAEFEGKLTFEGTVHIEGRFKGEIFSEGTLIVGEGADVQAEIRVGSVVIQGNVVGNVTASDTVELLAPASLRGNIASPALHIGKGVFFDGTCQMTSKAAAPVSRPATQQPMRSAQMPMAQQPPPMPALREPQQHIRESQQVAMAAPAGQRPSGIFLPEPSNVRTSGELPHKF